MQAATRLGWTGATAVAVSLAALSLLLVPAAPSYDAWSWLLWGRELSGFDLSTAEGPAWKPLPALVCALLAPLGSLAPTVWVVLARAGAIAGALFAYRLAGIWAALGVALTGGYISLAAQGNSEGLLVGLALGGAALAREGRQRWAVACFVGCALLRVETWPFLIALAVYAGWRWRLVAASGAVVALWFVPEWLASGQLTRSADRALVPNPGQPALADFPALASVGDALPLLFWPIALAAFFAPRRAQLWAVIGVTWIGVVALMAQLGFSGEWRYAVPGAAAIAVAGGAGLRARPKVAYALAVPVLIVTGARAADLAPLREREQARAELQADLREAVANGGGREQLLRCGQPYVGRYRGPLLAYALNVEKQVVDADHSPTDRGVVFRSYTDADAAPAPAAPTHFRPVASTGRWTVLSTCDE